ncbi:MAG: GerMN domain-containing protein [Acidobacteria bacterium]|nr:GerMN domain-containing protein [Acidobacteriota bacterium]
MASTRRIAVLAVFLAVIVGVGTWAAVRYFVGPPGGPEATGTNGAPAVNGDTRHIKATLFFVAADGLHLEPAERDVIYEDGTAEQARRIVEALLQPAPGGLTAAVPPGTTVRAVYVDDSGAAYVDFNSALRTNHPGGSINEILTVYAIVSALTVNLPAITSVQILIDGHEVDTLAGHVDLRRPLPRAQHWMEKGPA